MRSSMSRGGDCGGRGSTESLYGSLKVVGIHERHFATRRSAMDEVIDWLGFYNGRRLHPALDNVSPMTLERNWFADRRGEAA
ncbi:IS3 family transposase ISBxe2 [Paraburkholderia ultramafica]|uniref:IS3 family transposase ISBxe2 n=1 Tax=Paraburkholderia ultramafica TaxID=1544867 RepID=A0A6S7C139_9BURK|nr:IS3 family transposase ISBxe2 [Paraburkholderia ultramafica]